jgi:hypothetical protein
MGCDIHAYLEFKRPQDERWVSFGKQLSLGRNYRLFALLANVRGDGAVIPPKGIPRDLGYHAQDAYLLWVTDQYPDGDGSTSTAKARRWVAQGISEWWTPERKYVTDPDAHTPSWLTTAEYADVLRAYQEHRPEWEEEAAREIEVVRRRDPTLYEAFYARREAGTAWALDVCYSAALGAMCAAEEAGHAARLVLWFDN